VLSALREESSGSGCTDMYSHITTVHFNVKAFISQCRKGT